MIVTKKYALLCGASVAWLMLGDIAPLFAQEIIVTARKREETLQDVPVVVTALNAEQIEDYAINSITDLTAIVPGLAADATSGAGPQGTISLRGVGTGATGTGSDQAVAINVDGVQIESVNALRLGQIDLQQIEILKGPQPLFFGKNSTAGVIAVTTANPTPDFFAKVRAGYEFNAKERFGEVVLSGPLTDTLGARAVGYVTSVDGWMKNVAINPVADRTAPDYNEIVGRLTLQWEPTSNFDVLAKITHGKKNSGQRAYNQKIFCSDPTAETGDCVANDIYANADPFTDPRPSFFDTRTTVAMLEMNYSPSDTITLSSVTGFYKISQNYRGNIVPRDVQLGPTFDALRTGSEKVESLSQELRVTSDFGGQFNFMVGAFFDHRSIDIAGDFNFGRINFPAYAQRVEAESFSLFGQSIWDITETLELAGGLRWTTETKRYSGVLQEAAGPAPVGTPMIPLRDELSFHNLSPEATLSWRPNADITIYGAWKKGFKSGSFDTSQTGNAKLAINPGVTDIGFEAEKVEGGEVGIKTMLANRSLRLNFAAYRYLYENLQLTAFDPETVATRLLNAGGATVQGVEFDAAWSPNAFDGLTISGGVNYNHARYDEFVTDCNQTQFSAGTCPLDLRAPVGPESQDLAGQPLINAPDWSGFVGFRLDRPFNALDEGVGFRLGVNLSYSSDFVTDDRNEPNGIQDSYALLHANIGIYSDEDGWELGLIGRNLTDKHYYVRSQNQPFTGGGGAPQDQMATTQRGREVLLQLTLRPAALFK